MWYLECWRPNKKKHAWTFPVTSSVWLMKKTNYLTIYSNSRWVTATGDELRFSVWWFLAILWKWRHMCLFSKSRTMLWVNVVNMGVVFARMMNDFFEVVIFILSSNFFLVLTKHILVSSNRSDYAITIQYRLPALLTLPLDQVVAMSFVPFGTRGAGGGAAALPEDWERRRKKLGEECSN